VPKRWASDMAPGRSLGGNQFGDRSAWLIVPLVVIVAWWWWGNLGPPPEHEHSGGSTSSASVAPDDSEGDLRLVAVVDLPREAVETIALIKAGGPFPYAADNGVFGNFEGLLPSQPQGYYREYTVATPGVDTRGARRIVVGEGGEYYWTSDHYRSFERIDEP
jgi:ribonuclease T1